VHLETIRYYERIGLMPEPGRGVGGHRRYEDGHRARLAFIRRSRDLGFGLDDIRGLLELSAPHRRSCDEVRAIADRHLRDVRAKIDDLVRLEAVLAETVVRCGAQAPTDGACPVLDVLEAPRAR
jgi:MerR family mercuric resistance operon transcriptional regulator